MTFVESVTIEAKIFLSQLFLLPSITDILIIVFTLAVITSM